MIFTKIYELDNLQAAWQRVRANRPAPGIDRIRWEDFETHLSYNLQTLQKQLGEETYQPLPVAVFHKRQTAVKGKEIGISTIRDKVVQQAILKVIGPHFEKNFLPCSYAYRPGKSALAAVHQATRAIRAGKLWVLQMDVENFFDTMNHALLLDLIRRVIDEKPLLRLLARLLKAKMVKEMGLFDHLAGSQIGSGLSPLLSNIYLHPLDTVLWQKYKHSYLRYSDDLALLAEEQEHLTEAQVLIERCLGELKLAPQPQKTAITHVSNGIVYLGFYLDVKGKGPSKKSLAQLHAKLAEYHKLRKSDPIADKLNEVTATIRGWYNYYQTLKPIRPGNILTLLALTQLAKEFGEMQLARQWLKESKNYSHPNAEVSFQLGELFSSFGLHNQAMREYAQALELDPTLERAKERVRNLQEGEANIHRAIKKTQLVLHHNPHYREGYQKLAEYYTDLGLYGFAEKAHQKALELDDDPEGQTTPLRSESLPSAHQDDWDYRAVDQEAFLNTFRGRQQAHAKQWVDERGRWGFVRVERPLKVKDVYQHLKGELTLGVYPVTARDTVNFIVFDVDTARRHILESHDQDLDKFRHQAHADLLRIKNVCDQLNLALYLEDSGYKGRHGWLFFHPEVPATLALHLGREIIIKAGGPSDGMIWELFPMGKSDRHQSIIKLPLGINRKNNRRCLFLTEANQPYADQALFIKTIKRNPLDDIKKILDLPGEPGSPDQEVDGQPRGPLTTDPGLQKLLTECKIINHLVAKARDTNYLNHYERLCLLYTLSFAGQEGCRLLHKVISYCINYDYQYTQRQIERRQKSPISCAKIMEYFPELAETLPCNCKFTPPPRGYPSPVLYLLEAEIERAYQVPASPPEPPDQQARPGKKATPEEPPVSGPVLNFAEIFASETSQGEAREAEPPSAEPPRDYAVREDGTASSAAPPLAAETVSKADYEEFFENDQGVTASPPEDLSPGPARPPAAKPRVSHLAAWELALEYLKLRHRQAQVHHDLEDLSTRLNRLFDELNADVIQTAAGSLRRERLPDGQIKWILVTGD